MKQTTRKTSRKRKETTDTTDSLLGTSKTPKRRTTRTTRTQKVTSKTKTTSTSRRRGKITSTTAGTKRRAQTGRTQNNRPQGKRTNTGRTTRKTVKKTSASLGGLRIIPLGGQEEVGRNMSIFEYGNDIVLLDMGLQFPEEDMPGIDYIIPNVSYLKGKEKNIRAVIFSHGHLDHIGAAPMLLEKLGNPLIIGSDLTIALIKNRQEDYKKGSSSKLKTMILKDLTKHIPLGKLTAKFFAVEHSIADAVGLILESPDGTVIHPGDWALEKNPSGGRKPITYEHLANVKRPSILMLESLGIHYKESRVPEEVMHANLQKIIREAAGRVIIGTFSSQIPRISQIMDYAAKIGKKVALDGYSMKLNVKVSQELGYIKPNKNVMITVDQIDDYDDDKVVLICTGAQGESNAVLSRIIAGNHKFVNIKKSDTIVFSSSVIPGNEATVQRVKDNLYRLSDNIIDSNIMDVHSGGHSTQSDIREVLHQIKPDYFLPVYAYHFMLKETQKLAWDEGFKKDQVHVLDNGSIFEIKGDKTQVTHDEVDTSYVFVDGLGVGDISNVVLRDRQVMSTDGMLVVIATIDKKTGRLINNPDLISRGFIYMKESKKLVEDTRKKAIQLLKDEDPRTAVQEQYIKDKIRNQLGKFLFQKTQRRPMILPVIIEV